MHAEERVERAPEQRCTGIVLCWCLAICLAPPNGLLWQSGTLQAFGKWLVHGVLATLNLSGLVY